MIVHPMIKIKLKMEYSSISQTRKPLKRHSKVYVQQQIYLLKLGKAFNHIILYRDFKNAEECYSIYIAIMEVIYGNNSVKAGNCYYFLAIFYQEQDKI